LGQLSHLAHRQALIEHNCLQLSPIKLLGCRFSLIYIIKTLDIILNNN
jgi:hypothetical protein